MHRCFIMKKKRVGPADTLRTDPTQVVVYHTSLPTVPWLILTSPAALQGVPLLFYRDVYIRLIRPFTVSLMVVFSSQKHLTRSLTGGGGAYWPHSFRKASGSKSY